MATQATRGSKRLRAARTSTIDDREQSRSLSFSLADDNLLLALSYLNNSDLAAAACSCRHLCSLAVNELELRRREQAQRDADARRAAEEAQRRATERFAVYEDDAIIVATVLRHMLHCAPRVSSVVTAANGRKHFVEPSGGVCRMRVAVDSASERTGRFVDALALSENALRAVRFQGEPLGATGAAVALRQARALHLCEPAYQRVHGKVFKLWLRADVLRAYLEHSPKLSQLLAAVDA